MRELSVFEVKHVAGGGGAVLGQASSNGNSVSIIATNDVTKLLPGKQYGIVVQGTFADIGDFMQALPDLFNDAIANIGERIEGMWDQIVNAVSDFMSKLASMIGNLFTPDAATP